MARTTRVGLLVAVALGLFAAIVFMLGQQRHFWERKVPYELHFARTNGLQEGGDVSLSGVAVGSVTDLDFSDDPASAYIKVSISVTARAAEHVREDSVASIRTYGLLGDRYIEISPGSRSSPPAKPGALLTSVDPMDLESLFGQSGDIVTNVVEVTAQLKDVLATMNRGEGLLGAMLRNKEFGEQTLAKLDDTLTQVQSTSQALATIMTRVERGEGLAGYLLRDTPQSRQLVASLQHTTKSLDDLAAQLAHGGGLVPRLATDEAYARRVLDRLDAVVTNLQEITAKVDRGDGTAGKLVNDPRLYDEAYAVVQSFRTSWVLKAYRGVTGIWPFGGSGGDTR